MNTSGLIAEGRNGSEDFGPSGGNVRFDLEKDGNDSESRITDCTKDIAITGKIKGGGWTPDVQSKSVKRVRGFAITGRATVDVGDSRLSSGTDKTKRQR